MRKMHCFSQSPLSRFIDSLGLAPADCFVPLPRHALHATCVRR
jgi:hypothetical protein